MKIRRGALAALLAGGLFMSQLSGCGGGGGSSSTASGSTTLAGTAMAGPFLSGQACAYRVASGAKGALLGSCANLASSAFSIDIGDYTGDVLIEIPAGATYDDEANPGDDTTGTTLTGALRTLINVGSAGGTTNVAVTPLTETAVRLAGATLDAATVQAAITQLLAVLPTVNGLDLRSTVPVTTTNLGLAYREMLRALSNLQWVAGGNAAYTGGLDAYLAVLIGQIGSNGNTVGADLLSQLNSGLNGNCTVSNGELACTASTGGGSSSSSSSSSSGGSSSSGSSSSGGSSSGVTCDTTLFQPGAVQTPTANELATFARTYTGSEGSFDDNFNFVASGAASLVFNANGSATYNSAAYTPSSYCLENLNGGGQQLVIHAGTSHFDLRTDGGWNGIAPNGNVVNDTPYGGGGGSTGSGLTLSTSVGGISSLADTTVAMVDQTNTGPNVVASKKASWGSALDSINFVVAYVSITSHLDGTDSETLTLALAKFSPMTSSQLNVSGGTCVLSGTYPLPSCAAQGISFDKTTGLVSFTNTSMTTPIGTAGVYTINGSLSFTPF